MERDEFVQQGKVLADMVLREVGTQAAQHSDQIRDALGTLAGFVNDQTGGRYADQIGRAADLVERGVDLLAAQAPDRAGPSPEAPGPASGPLSGPSSGGPDVPSGQPPGPASG